LYDIGIEKELTIIAIEKYHHHHHHHPHDA